MNTKLLAGLVAIPILLGSTYAVDAAFNQAPNGNGADNSQREAIHSAIENGDYQAFLNAQPENGPLAGIINESNFSTLQEIHALKEAGNDEAAKELATSIGLPERPGHGGEHGKGGENREVVKTAIESGNYDAFVEAVGSDSPMLENINASNFSQFVEMHTLREAGDQEGAQAIAQQLGLPERPDRGGHDCDQEGGQRPQFGQNGPQNNQNIQ